jgi:mannose-1-phosphate guanylyltransferase
MVDSAFILAGGIGSRLKPLTDKIPKPLLPIRGKSILEYNIELLTRHRVKRIVLGLGHMADRIEKYFAAHPVKGVQMYFNLEPEALGTAGALKLAEKYFTSTFFMLNGDELKDVDINKVLMVHRTNKAQATIALTRVDNVSEFGVVDVDGSRIKRFVEKPKPKDAPSNLINSGLYILEPSVLNLIKPNAKVSIERDIFPILAAEGKLYGCPFNGQWYPTDTIERYRKAVKEWRGIS